MGWFSSFWNTAGTGIVAGTMIVLWDILRIWIQSKWLVKKLAQPQSDPHEEILRQLKNINEKLGVNNDSGNISPD